MRKGESLLAISHQSTRAEGVEMYMSYLVGCLRKNYFFLMDCIQGRLAFTLASVSLVLVLSILKRNRLKARFALRNDLQDYMDWVDAADPKDALSDGISRRTSFESFLSAEEENEHFLFRALASLGMAPTSPKQARVVRSRELNKSLENSAHPATNNDELADDVVRLKRVSEEEEAERYFAPFSRT